jgi:hypothetical protein
MLRGDTFIYHEDLGRVEKQIREPAEHYDLDRNVWIWKKPEKNGIYLIACDVSRGDARRLFSISYY